MLCCFPCKLWILNQKPKSFSNGDLNVSTEAKPYGLLRTTDEYKRRALHKRKNVVLLRKYRQKLFFQYWFNLGFIMICAYFSSWDIFFFLPPQSYLWKGRYKFLLTQPGNSPQITTRSFSINVTTNLFEIQVIRV